MVVHELLRGNRLQSWLEQGWLIDFVFIACGMPLLIYLLMELVCWMFPKRR